MNYKRRDVIQHIGKIGLSAFLAGTLATCMEQQSLNHISQLVYNPDNPNSYWKQIRSQYQLPENLIYLNSAGAGPQPISVFNAYQSYLEIVNEAPSYVLFRKYAKQLPFIRNTIASLLDCHESEVVLTRNATEAIQTIIFGLDFSPGDEIITTTRDYPTVLQGLQQRFNRNGIIIRKIIPQVPLLNEETLLNQIDSEINSKTKLIIVSHIEYVTGAILPVKRICDLAHAKGVEVLLDGAQSLAQIDLSLQDIDCDYFAASLHKWLSAPIGTGVLFIKKDKIEKVWPLFADDGKDASNINKFAHLGTRDLAALLAVKNAFDFHQSIGIERKQIRLKALTSYVMSELSKYPQVQLLTPLENSCAIINFSIKGMAVNEVDKFIKEEGIYGSAMRNKSANGLRISPNIFTTFDELNYLIQTIDKLIA